MCCKGCLLHAGVSRKAYGNEVWSIMAVLNPRILEAKQALGLEGTLLCASEI